ncbi:MAG: translation elongation factor-like protein [Candidatus Bathyarchaeia archaeon]
MSGAEELKLENVGKVTHFFTKISVAIVELTGTLSIGDKILIKGPTTNLEQTVDSMQIEHKNVQTAKKGDSIGLKVNERVREGDIVYKILE